MTDILIVEDEPIIRQALIKLLQRNGYEAHGAESVEQALSQGLERYHLLLVDLRLPGRPGTALIKAAYPIPVLIMTSYASVESAVDAMKQGAADYIAKPFEHEALLSLIKKTLKHNTPPPTHGMIGESPAMQALFTHIRKVAPTSASVLILGESGTGKELVARALHAQSKRAQGPFVVVNCAAIPEHLVESELFGHVKGAYTGAEHARPGLIQSANGGTLFLDEIAELPMSMQAHLLRVLQNGELRPVGSEKTQQVDVRILAATNRDLPQMVEQGMFREDLFYRLNVVALHLPPLRQRQQDIKPLAEYLLQRTCERLQRPPMHFAKGVLEQLAQYNWPGNVRELENAIERAVILCESQHINWSSLGIAMSNPEPPSTNQSLDEYFKTFVLEHQDQLTETELARQLGISRKTLWQKRQRLGIPRRKSN